MFRALCSSSGGQIVLIQHLVSTLPVNSKLSPGCARSYCILHDQLCLWPLRVPHKRTEYRRNGNRKLRSRLPHANRGDSLTHESSCTSPCFTPFSCSWKSQRKSKITFPLEWDRGGTVVKVLCYKSEGRWSDIRWCHWNFHWHNPSDRTYGPGVDSASNRNEYQENFLGVNAVGA